MSTKAALRTAQEVLSQLGNLDDEEAGRILQRMNLLKEVLSATKSVEPGLLRAFLANPIAFNFFALKDGRFNASWKLLDSYAGFGTIRDDVNRQAAIAQYLGKPLTQEQLYLYWIVLDRIGRQTRNLLQTLGFIIVALPQLSKIQVADIWKKQTQLYGGNHPYPPDRIGATPRAREVLPAGVYLVPTHDHKHCYGCLSKRYSVLGLTPDPMKKNDIEGFLAQVQEVLYSLGCTTSEIRLPNLWEAMATKLLASLEYYPEQSSSQWATANHYWDIWVQNDRGNPVPANNKMGDAGWVMPLIQLHLFDAEANHLSNNPGAEYEFLRNNQLLPLIR